MLLQDWLLYMECNKQLVKGCDCCLFFVNTNTPSCPLSTCVLSADTDHISNRTRGITFSLCTSVYPSVPCTWMQHLEGTSLILVQSLILCVEDKPMSIWIYFTNSYSSCNTMCLTNKSSRSNVDTWHVGHGVCWAVLLGSICLSLLFSGLFQLLCVKQLQQTCSGSFVLDCFHPHSKLIESCGTKFTQWFFDFKW